jgi:hypothetical protein
MAGPTKIATPAGGGIQSIQDLYNLINGESTVTSGGSSTVSGGTTTKTESGAFSQDAMNAMLKSALESSQGLASVAGGQRTAGGYSSATNRLLVNDLMTRSAAQIAQLNQTKTTTVSAPDVTTSAAPKTTTVGGVTPGGVATGAGYLAALNALEKTGSMDWLKKNIFGDTAAATATPSAAGTVVADANEVGPMVGTGGAGKPGETAVGGYDVYTPTIETPSAAYDAYVPVEEAPAPTYDAPMVGPNENVYDKLEFADGGLVGKHPMVQMADGGSVKKQLGSMVGTQSNIVIDPRKGLIGGAGGTNPDGTPIVANVGSNTGSGGGSGSSGIYDSSRGNTYGNAGVVDRTGTDSSSTQSINAGAKALGNAGKGLQAFGAIAGDKTAGKMGQTLGIASAIPGLMGVADRVTAGTATKNDLGFTSNVIGRVANLAENPALRDVATLGNLAASKTPGQLAFNVADLASKGVLSKTKGVADALMTGSLSSTVNAVASFNPMTAAYNAIAGFFDAASLGDVANNTRAALDPNSSVQLGDVFSNMGSTVVENERTNIVSNDPTSTDVQVDMANDTATATGVDPLDALMNVTDAFGTSDGSRDTSTGYGPSSPDYSGDRGPGGSSGTTGGVEVADGGLISNLVTPGNNAGQVQGPGTTTSDSVNAKLSKKEYVLPADVVEMIGVDNLDALIKKYHVPAEVQKLRNFART